MAEYLDSIASLWDLLMALLVFGFAPAFCYVC
jgi:hypothetical protein